MLQSSKNYVKEVPKQRLLILLLKKSLYLFALKKLIVLVSQLHFYLASCQTSTLSSLTIRLVFVAPWGLVFPTLNRYS